MYTMRPEQMLQTLAAGIVELLIPNLPVEVRPQADAMAAVARHLSIGLPRRHMLMAQENREILTILRLAQRVLANTPDVLGGLCAEIEELIARAGKAEDVVELNAVLRACLERVISAFDFAADDLAQEDLAEMDASIAAYLRGQLDRDLALYDAAFARGWRGLRVATVAPAPSGGTGNLKELT